MDKENIAKVVAPIDITLDDALSFLWKFAGFSVEDGAAPKRVKGGGKLQYNSQPPACPRIRMGRGMSQTV